MQLCPAQNHVVPDVTTWHGWLSLGTDLDRPLQVHRRLVFEWIFSQLRRPCITRSYVLRSTSLHHFCSLIPVIRISDLGGYDNSTFTLSGGYLNCIIRVQVRITHQFVNLFLRLV